MLTESEGFLTEVPDFAGFSRILTESVGCAAASQTLSESDLLFGLCPLPLYPPPPCRQMKNFNCNQKSSFVSSLGIAPSVVTVNFH